MNKIAFTFWIVCILILVLITVFLYIRGKVELSKEKKKNQKEREKEHKIDEEMLENINSVVGDDIHAGNDILHQLAQKRK